MTVYLYLVFKLPWTIQYLYNIQLIYLVHWK